MMLHSGKNFLYNVEFIKVKTEPVSTSISVCTPPMYPMHVIDDPAAKQSDFKVFGGLCRFD